MNKVCSIDSISSIILEKLDSNFDECFESSKNLSTINSFGSIYSNRGSVRVVPNENITALSLNTDTNDPTGPTASFTTCTVKNLAIILVPIVPTSVEFEMHVRYTSSIDSIASIIDDTVFMRAMINGSLMLSYELTSNLIMYSRPNIDITFNGYWQNRSSFNDKFAGKNQDLVDSIKIDTVLTDYLFKLNSSFNAKKMQNILRSKNESIGCIVSQHLPMTCTINTTVVPQYCHPCDTCCNCMIRQICDGACSSCPCVNCYQREFSLVSIISISFILCSFLIVWHFV